ncbi:MAG: hypothetical protein K2J74_07055 [Muribaculaceae bacterium]|nr:hypothetical protein [Muribaculaceae bacterium]
MKRISLFVLLSLVWIMGYSETKIKITIGDKSMAATLADNEATKHLASMLTEAPITIAMNDYGGFEKVGTLPTSLPTSNSNITTVPGDIMLYQGNNMVIFYGSNTWSYTRLGKIDGATAVNIREFLGIGNISVTLSLNNGTGSVEQINGDVRADEKVYDIEGHLITERPLPKGIYIINGKKKAVR